MKQFLHLLYQPYKWLIYIPFLAASTLVFGITAALLAVFVSPKLASFIGGALWAKLNCIVTPIFVKVKGRENIDKRESYVIVSNHQSQFDIFVLYGYIGIDFKWVMKYELRKIPGLGIGCEKIGHVFIDRSNSEKAIASLRAAKERIVNGTSIIFFPEGTRRDGNTLGEFKKGAFKMALDLNLPILPVIITGTEKILPAKTLDLFPGCAQLRIGKPIAIDGYDDSNIDQLVQKTKKAMESILNGD